MPSEKVLEHKKQLVAELTNKMQKAVAAVIVDYHGINVADDTKLRRDLREAGIDYVVAKNTLLRFAAKEAGLDDITEILKGTTAVAFSDSDYVAAARILCKFSQTSKTFKVKGGFVDGNALDSAAVTQLSKLPAREVLVAQALAGFNAPITSFVGVLNANLRGLVCALNAIAEKQSA